MHTPIVTFLILCFLFGSLSPSYATDAEQTYQYLLRTDQASIRHVDTELNKAWKRLKSLLTKNEFSQILKEQRAWIAQRNELLEQINVHDYDDCERVYTMVKERVQKLNARIAEKLHQKSPLEGKYQDFLNAGNQDVDQSLKESLEFAKDILSEQEFAQLMDKHRIWLQERDRLLSTATASNDGFYNLSQFMYDHIHFIDQYYIDSLKKPYNMQGLEAIDPKFNQGGSLSLNGPGVYFSLEDNNVIAYENFGLNQSEYNTGIWYAAKDGLILYSTCNVPGGKYRREGDTFVHVNDSSVVISISSYVPDKKFPPLHKDPEILQLITQANNGSAEAALTLSQKYGAIEDTRNRDMYLVKAAELGNKQLYEQAGMLCYDYTNSCYDLKKAIMFFEKALAKKTLSADGQLTLGFAYFHQNSEKSKRYIFACAAQKALLDQASSWNRDILLLYATYLEKDDANALRYWEKIHITEEELDKNDRYFFRTQQERMTEYKERLARIQAMSDHDILKIVQESSYKKFTVKDGYRTIGEAFNLYFQKPTWKVVRKQKKNQPIYEVYFSGILTQNDRKALFENSHAFSLDNNENTVWLRDPFPPKINGEQLSQKEFNDLLYDIFLETRR